MAKKKNACQKCKRLQKDGSCPIFNNINIDKCWAYEPYKNKKHNN